MNNYSSLKQSTKTSARLDFMQSATGLFLALFMWGHMIFVSTILISKDFMYKVSKTFEADFLFEGGEPIIVSIFALFIFTIFIAHALLAMRKLPINLKQYKSIKIHANTMDHTDTKLWFVQAYTGFAMFFLGSIHLYTIMANSDKIGPYASSDRIVSDFMWPLYILLLLAVEFHGSIGLYRLSIKWGWFNAYSKDSKKLRAKLKIFKWFITIFFLTLGTLSLVAYIKIGIEHKNDYGKKYIPSYEVKK